MNPIKLNFFIRKLYQSRDLWQQLQKNWTFFFWLTGESPPTFQLMVDEIEREFSPNVHNGRPPILDFQNQVSYDECTDT